MSQLHVVSRRYVSLFSHSDQRWESVPGTSSHRRVGASCNWRHQQMDIVQPNTRTPRRQPDVSRHQAFKAWGSRNPAPDPQCLLAKYSQMNSSHTFWSSVATPVSCFLRGRAARTVSRKIECVASLCSLESGYKLRKSCRCRPPRRPHRFFQRFRFCFPTGSWRILEQAVIDSVSRAKPASFSFAQDAVELPRRTWRESLCVWLLFAIFKTRSRAKSIMLKTGTNPV